MTKSHAGRERVSLVRLPFSQYLLSSKIAQIDGAIQYLPFVRSSAGGEAFYRFVLMRVQLPRRVTIDLTVDRQIPVSGNIDAVSCVNGIFKDRFSKRPRGGMQLREFRAENATGSVRVFRGSHVVGTFQGPYVTLPEFGLPCDRLVAPDHIEIASESRVHFAALLNC